MYIDYFDKFMNMKPYLEINEKEWKYIKINGKAKLRMLLLKTNAY